MALAGLMLLSPIIGAVAILVWWRLGNSVLFRQERSGLHGRVFQVFKFRTMTDATDKAGNLLPDAERLTAFGRFLRSSSLDELPQLWNVLTGDMSMVGPRPLLPRYDKRYTARQRRRLDVLPGITGWAQVNGRNAVSWPERLEMDAWYADNCSFLLDVHILVKTVSAVFTARDINLENHATCAEFLPAADRVGE
jgi:lipopolysaccharide/colanic/teichoic acid biosynthesis glycosyltransferase